MKKICILAAFVTILISESINCQTNSGGIAAELEGMYRRIRENISSAEKLAINDSIRLIIQNYAVSDTVFNHRFSNLRYLGQITSPDSLIKIITWNLILEDGGNRYFCYFIHRESAGGKNIVYKLSGVYNEETVRTDTIYSESNWYGALYYDIRPFTTAGGEKCYVLLGIDYGNSFITRKIIDVLSFVPGNNLVLGKKCFSSGQQILSRVVFEYTSKAVMSLKFESDRLIVFDHLSPVSPDLKDNRQFYGPDFSFDSYYFENGLWKLKEDIDIRNKEDKRQK
jgi:hypothetical protein